MNWSRRQFLTAASLATGTLSLGRILAACSPTVRPVRPGKQQGGDAAATAPASTPQPGGLLGGFFAVHVESQHPTATGQDVGGDWHLLQEMVAAAEALGHRLTLEFLTPWAQYAAQTPSILDEVRQWESRGHEVAFHHHAFTHAFWDGYSDVTAHTRKPGYIGSLQDALAWTRQLSSTGRIFTGSMEDADVNWPAELSYLTGDGKGGGGGLVSTPASASYNSTQVTQVTYQGYLLDLGESRTSLEDIENGLLGATSGQVLGLVAHPHNHAAHVSEFAELFGMLADHGMLLQGLKEILSA